MIITDDVLLSRSISGQVFSVQGEWFYMDAACLLYHLPAELIQYIREIEALRSIGKVLRFDKPFLDNVNISNIKHTSLVRRLFDPTKDSSQLRLSQGKSIFIKDAAVFSGNMTLRVQTPDNQIAADIVVQSGKPISISETSERLPAIERKAAIPYGYLCRGSSFAPLEVRML